MADKYDYSQAAPPRITWTEGFTLNTGNFESLKLQVSFEDIKRPGETAREASERIFDFVNDSMEEKVRAARRAFNG